jgi:hypothetical protein
MFPLMLPKAKLDADEVEALLEQSRAICRNSAILCLTAEQVRVATQELRKMYIERLKEKLAIEG